MLPFKLFQTVYEEKEKKEMKETQLFDDKNTTLVKTFLKEDLAGKEPGQKYELKGSLYCKSLMAYVFPRKFNGKDNTYACRSKANEKEVVLDQTDLSNQIFVFVRTSKNVYPDEKEEAKDLTKVKIKLTDQLQKVVELITDGQSGSLFASGKVLIDLEQTVEKADLHEG